MAVPDAATSALASAPAWETHASLILGAIAFVLAIVTLPTAFQMFFGRPRIEFDFDTDHQADWTRLRCNIRNQGMRSRFLRWLGVTRSPVEISADFGVVEYKTGREIVHMERATITTDRQQGLHVDLPFAVSPARFFVVFHTAQNGAFVYRGASESTHLLLQPGTYVARIEVITAHQEFKTTRHKFTVGIDPPGTFWIGPDDG